MIKNETVADIGNHLASHLPSYLDLLQQMVAINSFTANARGVNALGDLTAAAFAELGFTAERIQAAEHIYGQHLVLSRPGQSRNGHIPPTIGLVSHLDTVYPAAEESENDFYWRPSGQRIYGPGTYDIKGGTVTILMMLSALRAAAPALFDSVHWVVLLNAAEEALVPDFGELALAHLGPSAIAALVFEGGEINGHQPGSYKLVVARKGMARFRLFVEGKAAHAGTAHQEGANAIVQLAELIGRVAELTDYERQVTFNVGTIAGGTVINRVPHQAVASVEMRAFSPAVFTQRMEEMQRLAQQVTIRSAAGAYPCKINVEVLGTWQPWAPNIPSRELCALWSDVASTLDLHVESEERGGLSDGNWTWLQVPTIDGLGPDGGNAHCSERSADGTKDQEFILPSSFVPKAHLNAVAVMRLVESYYRSGTKSSS